MTALGISRPRRKDPYCRIIRDAVAAQNVTNHIVGDDSTDFPFFINGGPGHVLSAQKAMLLGIIGGKNKRVIKFVLA
jgi:hypothetical protein